MKLIRTEHGEWFNPELIKHFGIQSGKLPDGSDSYYVHADGIQLKNFSYKIFYAKDDDGDWQIAPDCDADKLRQDAYDAAVDYLDDLVGKLNGGANS